MQNLPLNLIDFLSTAKPRMLARLSADASRDLYRVVPNWSAANAIDSDSKMLHSTLRPALGDLRLS